MASKSYKLMLYLLAAIWVLVAIALGIGAFAQFSGRFSIQQVQMLSNVFLVILTGAYAASTTLLLYETARHREQDIQPAFALKVVHDGIEVSNVGNGPALQADLQVVLFDDKMDTVWEESRKSISNLDLPTNDRILVEFETGWWVEVRDNTHMKLEGNYVDQYGDRHAIGPRTRPVRKLHLDDYARRHDAEEVFIKNLNDNFEEVTNLLEDLRETFDRQGDGGEEKSE